MQCWLIYTDVGGVVTTVFTDCFTSHISHHADVQADALAAELARIHRHRCGGMTDPDALFTAKGLSTRPKPAAWAF